MNCQATNGPPTTGPAGPSMANLVAMDGLAGPVVMQDHLQHDRVTGPGLVVYNK